MDKMSLQTSRRAAMFAGVAAAVGAAACSTRVPFMAESAPPMPLPARPPIAPAAIAPATTRFTVDPKILQKALAALDEHSKTITARDRIAIVDFSAPSSEQRLHFLDVESGKATRLLVAHGSGSDPGHTGFLKSFSNAFGSNASSEGAFMTDTYYVGKHGRSQRLIGLDATNNNALDRAIVIHSAWYANDEMVAAHGKLGRSQGCFAVGENRLDDVFGFLGKGRLVYAVRA